MPTHSQTDRGNTKKRDAHTLNNLVGIALSGARDAWHSTFDLETVDRKQHKRDCDDAGHLQEAVLIRIGGISTTELEKIISINV